MEGLIPYVYRAIVRYRSNTRQRIYGSLASSSPGDSGRFSWDSAYIRLPGDSNEGSFVRTSTVPAAAVHCSKSY